MLNKNQLALIHIYRQKLNLSDEEYRAILSNWTTPAGDPVKSSKELDFRQFEAVLWRFQTMLKEHSDEFSSRAQQAKIMELADGKINNLLAFSGKITGRDIAGLKDLSKKEAGKVINALRRYHRKDTKK